MSVETSPPGILSWQLVTQLRTALPFLAADYVAESSHKLLKLIAARADSQAEIIFFQLAATLATLSKKLTVLRNVNQTPTYPNQYFFLVGQPKAGKTNGQLYVGDIRKRIYAATGIDNHIPAGTLAGVYNSTVTCANRGGLPLIDPDEGIATLTHLLTPGKHCGSVLPEIFFSSAWSGGNVESAKATASRQQTQDARLSLLGVGTLADITSFHNIVKLHYANRGLLGRFCTAFTPTYLARCQPPDPAHVDDESMLALTTAQLSTLLVEACVSLFQAAELPTFRGFQFSDDALDYVTALRTAESAAQGEQPDGQHWTEVVKLKLLSDIQHEFRSTEMIEKWAIILHLFEYVVNSINFVEQTVSQQPVSHNLQSFGLLALLPPAQIIEVETVRIAEALVTRAYEQDTFFLQLMRITAVQRNRETIYVAENIDFLLYKRLEQIILVWPGGVVTSESFGDRCFKLGLSISIGDMCEAGELLHAYGSVSKEDGATRITSPGIFKQMRTPRHSFRFYKTHPDLIHCDTLAAFGIDLTEYTTRYNKDYYQIGDAQCLRSGRSEKKFDAWTSEIPPALLPSTCVQPPAPPAPIDPMGAAGHGAPQYPRHSKFQGEDPTLRFGPALQCQTRKRRHDPEEQQHVYRIPGAPTFTNSTTE